MFKLDEGAIVDRADDAFQNDGDEGDDTPGEVIWEAIRAELCRQISEGGGPGGILTQQLQTLLSSHKAMAEAGEEMPTVDALCILACGGDGADLYPEKRRSVRDEMARAVKLFRPTIARLRRERDEARHQRDDPWQERGPLLEQAERAAKTTYTVNVDTSEAQTKLETLLASAREYEATLDRALAKTQALGRGAPSFAERLKAAIRRITVDAPNDEPNGPTELALDGLQKSMHPDEFRGGQSTVSRALAIANDWGARLATAMADDTRTLRLTAEAFFGEDFSTPTAHSSCSDPANIGIGDPPPKPPPPPPSVAAEPECKHPNWAKEYGPDGNSWICRNCGAWEGERET